MRAARQPAGIVAGDEHLAAAIAQVEAATGRVLGQGQVGLAARFAVGGHLLEAGMGPAGAGKTTAMDVVARAGELSGGGSWDWHHPPPQRPCWPMSWALALTRSTSSGMPTTVAICASSTWCPASRARSA